MPRKKPRVLTFGLDKKIRDDTGIVVDRIELEKDSKLEFFIEFSGPTFSLWLVDAEGFYSQIYSSSVDGMQPERRVLGLGPGSYYLDCSLVWVSSLNVRILI